MQVSRKNIILNIRKWHSGVRYVLARFWYRIRHRKEAPLYRGPMTLGVQVAHPSLGGSLIRFPENYSHIVEGMYAEIRQRLTIPECRLVETGDGVLNNLLQFDEKKLQAEIQRGTVRNVKVRSAFDLPYLKEYVSFLFPQIEERVYGSHAQIVLSDIARVLACTLEEKSSTLWHTDHHFDSEMKVMLYLNDVTEENAPFEYLRHKETKEPVYVPSTYPPRYPNGRVPKEVIEEYLRNGYETYKVTGAAGTLLIFSDKVIHKGNYAKRGYRDTLTLMLDASLSPQQLPPGQAYGKQNSTTV